MCENVVGPICLALEQVADEVANLPVHRFRPPLVSLPGFSGVGFLFTSFSQAFKDRHFRKCEPNALRWFGTSMNWMQLAPNTRQMPTILVVAVEAAEMQYDSIETSEIS